MIFGRLRRPWWLLGLAGVGMVAVSIAPGGVARARPRGNGASAQSPHGTSITEGMQCSACHSQTTWAMSGEGAGQSDFDHATTGFPLSGRHRTADCGDCHRGDRAITRQCTGCHEDAHQRTLGQSCDRCHSAVDWADVAAIDLHRSTRLPLTGMHVLAACSECHVRASDNVWRGVPSDCYACHSGDYNREDIHPLHRGVPSDPTKPALPKNCAGCHGSTSFSPARTPLGFVFRSAEGLLADRRVPVRSGPWFAPNAGPRGGERPSLSRRSHDFVFPITFGKHRAAQCADCHASERVPRVVTCTGCHAHEPMRLARQHRGVGRIGSGCLHCHPGGVRR